MRDFDRIDTAEDAKRRESEALKDCPHVAVRDGKHCVVCGQYISKVLDESD